MGNAGPLILRNEFIRVGVINPGGRVVVLGRAEGPNVLKVDPCLLNGGLRRRRVSVRYRFRPWNGHTVWCGPQSAFWADQDEHPARRRRRAVWPPDPYGEVGWFAVTERTEHCVVLTGPESPVTGLQMTKTISLDGCGVRFAVSARNIRSRPVRWDLWPNTRLDGRARCYVPVGRDGMLRVQTAGSSGSEPVPHRLVEGYFTFDPVDPSPSARQRTSKAFLYPSAGEINAFCGTEMLRIRFDLPPCDQIHPEQAAVELYNAVTRDGDALLELETHGAYRTLEPGASMNLEQRWNVWRYDGTDEEAARIAFLKQLDA